MDTAPPLAPLPPDPSIEQLKERIKVLEAIHGQNDMPLAVAFGLTPTLSNLLGLLLSHQYVADAGILKLMPKIRSGAKTLVHRLRKSLAAFDSDNPIVIHSQRNVGYWIDDPTKERIRAFAFLDASNRRKPNCPPTEEART